MLCIEAQVLIDFSRDLTYIEGFNDAKIEKYGDAVLSVIRNYLNTNHLKSTFNDSGPFDHFMDAINEYIHEHGLVSFAAQHKRCRCPSTTEDSSAERAIGFCLQRQNHSPPSIRLRAVLGFAANDTITR